MRRLGRYEFQGQSGSSLDTSTHPSEDRGTYRNMTRIADLASDSRDRFQVCQQKSISLTLCATTAEHVADLIMRCSFPGTQTQLAQFVFLWAEPKHRSTHPSAHMGADSNSLKSLSPYSSGPFRKREPWTHIWFASADLICRAFRFVGRASNIKYSIFNPCNKSLCYLPKTGSRSDEANSWRTDHQSRRSYHKRRTALKFFCWTHPNRASTASDVNDENATKRDSPEVGGSLDSKD